MRGCENCGGEIPPQRRSDAKFCKDACKREAFDARHASLATFYGGFAGIRRRRPSVRAGQAVA